MKWIKSIYLNNRLFYGFIAIAALFVVSFFIKQMYPIVYILLYVYLAVLMIDFLVLFFQQKTVVTERLYPERFSNGDDNSMAIKIKNLMPFRSRFTIIEEVPFQLQKRDFEEIITLNSNQIHEINYSIRLTQRGEYNFGKLNIYCTYLGFFERRIIQHEPLMIKNYPSFLQLRQYTLLATTNQLHQLGVKKIRKIGSTTEFENIRTYTTGDEYRNINWKATGKAHKLMVNQYQEEKSQPVYNILDMGRSMRMPFHGLSLLDYAINSSLILSNVTLAKDEKAGIIAVNRKIEKHIVADRKNHQMQLILEGLYALNTEYMETDFGQLYSYAKKHLTQRSLLFIYTNFETIDALDRQILYLKLLKKSHVVVVVMFKNAELDKFIKRTPQNSMEIYQNTIAEKINFDKELIINRLHQYGIHTIYTEPTHLSVDTINKYLELKARGIF